MIELTKILGQPCGFQVSGDGGAAVASSPIADAVGADAVAVLLAKEVMASLPSALEGGGTDGRGASPALTGAPFRLRLHVIDTDSPEGDKALRAALGAALCVGGQAIAMGGKVIER
jgi:hypothetical protein